jgi:tetratricopeptide (TPR) repeat protein
VTLADRAGLEAERDFLLESIRRLDDDRAAGAITEAEYIDLRDEQTVRAANVLEALERTTDAPTARPPRPPAGSWAGMAQKLRNGRAHKKSAYWAAGVVAFVAIAIFAVASGATSRLTGQTSTGTIHADTNTLLAQAAQQSGKGNVADAVKTYDQVLKQDPRNVQALAYRGWLIRLAGLPQQGLDSINQALAINSNYPDAHFFKGYILFRDRQDAKSAIPEFNAFLADNPPSDLVPLVKETLQDAQAEAATQK